MRLTWEIIPVNSWHVVPRQNLEWDNVFKELKDNLWLVNPLVNNGIKHSTLSLSLSQFFGKSTYRAT